MASYVGEYLQGEIKAEALSRNIENFSRFLARAAFTNGQLINFESVADDAQVPALTVREYYRILEDSLIGKMIQPVDQLGSKKVVSKGKFYFFDLGVMHHLQGVKELFPHSPQFGDAFESLIFHELTSYLDYKKVGETLIFWRTSASGIEVDFVIGRKLAIEVKTAEMVDSRDPKGHRALAKVAPMERLIVVSRDPSRRQLGAVEIWPYREFLAALWGGEML